MPDVAGTLSSGRQSIFVARTEVKFAIWAAGIVVLVTASLRFVGEPYYDYIWKLPASGFAEVLPATASAAIQVWAFWALATVTIGGWLLQADAGLGLFDAIFGGAVGAWIFAYVAGNLLGPIGLFRGWTIWLIALAALVALTKKTPRLEFHAPSSGLQLALLACALMAIGVLPVQLGSPVPPYMDILNIPASAQRIVTFHRYLPWNNDPYGHWTPIAQVPGLELFVAFLAMGSATPLAVLADSAAILPMMCLIALSTWRLGRTFISDTAGGMAAVLLFATNLFMRGIQMRGVALAAVLVSGGLAFLLDRERRPVRSGLGAMMLGTAFASHAIDGAFAFATATAGVTMGFLEGDFANTAREALCLLGAILVAVPEFAVALVVRLPYPVLPACQAAGIALIYFAARGLTPRRRERKAVADSAQRGLIAALLALCAFFPWNIVRTSYGNFPTLVILSIGGLLLAATFDYRHSGGIWMAATALLVGDAVHYVIPASFRFFSNPQAALGLNDMIFKLHEYWSPYFLVFPAAILFEWAYRHWSRALAVALLLALVVFPWRKYPELDINFNERPLAHQWAVNWHTAETGWWGAAPDHRWLQSPAEFALIRKLRDEIAAGHITLATHIVHVEPESIIWQDELLYSLYLGIDDDLYVIKPGGNLAIGSTAGSRMHPDTMLPQALAADPPYIVIHHEPPSWLKLPPSGYDEIFSRDTLRLFRRRDLATASR
jgi:hypothetical protein